MLYIGTREGINIYKDNKISVLNEESGLPGNYVNHIVKGVLNCSGFYSPNRRLSRALIDDRPIPILIQNDELRRIKTIRPQATTKILSFNERPMSIKRYSPIVTKITEGADYPDEATSK